MRYVLFLIGMISVPACIVWFVIAFVKKKPKKQAIIGIAAGLVLFVTGAVTVPRSEPVETEPPSREFENLAVDAESSEAPESNTPEPVGPEQTQGTEESVESLPDSPVMETVDAMEGLDFEYWSAELLRRIGFENVEVTQASGDQGVDVIAGKDGIKYAVQCKRYSSNLGNSPVQEVHAGKSIYNCQIGAVITNQFFTSGAKELAESTGVLLWDRSWINTQLEKLAESGIDTNFEATREIEPTLEITPEPTLEPSDAPTLIHGVSSDTVVYVSNHSHIIHLIHDCSGMTNYKEMTIADADSKSYRYCPNCW